MEIYLEYQGKKAQLVRSETKYGTNLPEFSNMLELVLEGVGLRLDGDIKDISEDSNK